VVAATAITEILPAGTALPSSPKSAEISR